MKKLAIVLALAFCLRAQATILLTTPYSVTGPTGIAQSTALYATAISHSYDFQGNNACFIFAFGTTTATGGIDQSFTVLQGAPAVNFCMNLSTGSWTAITSNGVTISTGQITGTQLTSAQTYLRGNATVLRDAADYFASTLFLPGTQPNKWGSGDL